MRHAFQVAAAALLLVGVVVAVKAGSALHGVNGTDGQSEIVIGLACTPLHAVGGSGDAVSAISDVGTAAFDQSGALYLLDRMRNAVVVIDRDGSVRGEVGRQGAGPGEFRNAADAAVFRDGTVAVLDGGRPALVVYDRDGTWQRDVTVGLPSLPAGRIAQAGAGRVAFTAATLWVRGELRVVGSSTPPSFLPLAAVDLRSGAGELLHRAWTPAIPRPNVPYALPLLTPTLHWSTLSTGEILVADSLDYRIKVVGHDGHVLRTVGRPIHPRRTTAADRKWARDRQRSSLIGPGGELLVEGIATGDGSDAGPRITRDEIERGIAASPVHPEVQIIRRMAVDWDDRIWVRRAGTGSPEDGAIDVLTPDGSYVGTLADGPVPDAFGPDGLVAYVERDEYDAPLIRITRCELTPGGQ